MSDREIERLRYERAAESMLGRDDAGHERSFLAPGQDDHLAAPYIRFAELVDAHVRDTSVVCELGAGTGNLTALFDRRAGLVVATDISATSLKVSLARGRPNLAAICADMEQIPLADASADVIASAGALSYGDPQRVTAEMRRVLKPGGSMLIVDSLNHNPFYRLNRWIAYKQGRRTKSTIVRMPGMARIKELSEGFNASTVEFFGTYTYLYPVLRRSMGHTRACALLESLDRRAGKGRNAFKFVLAATDYRGVAPTP